ncbi:MAG: adenylyl-sulfate kinase, partial [Solirubrobacteraceae bacterium]
VSRSPNVTWQESCLSRARRWRALGAPGATVWLTGLPASGKSTIGAALEERLVSAGRLAYLLDGDNLRHGICGDLGFSAEDRARNIARVAEVAQLFADAGAIAIVALVSPIASSRRAARRLHERSGLRFIEVFLDTPLEVCIARDPKHLYARARAGEIDGFTGVDGPYERPSRAQLVLTDELGPSAAVDAVLELLQASDESAAGDRPAPPERQNQPLGPSGTTHRQNGVQR